APPYDKPPLPLTTSLTHTHKPYQPYLPQFVKTIAAARGVSSRQSTFLKAHIRVLKKIRLII
ncbi:hypothetical protein, partial [Bartonella elizabethae]|uniref:hypothetical protein n=1 Tax=Bartonella elizabethae TaxID=807 RepID=UPI001AEC4957